MAAATTMVARIHMPVRRSEKAATTSGGGGAGGGLWSHGMWGNESPMVAGGANEWERRLTSHIQEF
eukprot:scaffold1480_cov123-Isochrysis_galbana.AAC.4